MLQEPFFLPLASLAEPVSPLQVLPLASPAEPVSPLQVLPLASLQELLSLQALLPVQEQAFSVRGSQKQKPPAAVFYHRCSDFSACCRS